MSIADDRIRYQALKRLTTAFEAKLAAGETIADQTVGSIHTYARNRSELEKLLQNPDLFPSFTQAAKDAAKKAVDTLSAIGLPVPTEIQEILDAPLKPEPAPAPTN